MSDTDEDEMYRGEYYPRRTTDCNLSLEYFYVYSDATNQKNIALVAGIFETKKSADSLLHIVKAAAPNAFVYKGEVFVGCMH